MRNTWGHRALAHVPFALLATGQAAAQNAWTNVPGYYSWSYSEVIASTGDPSTQSPGVIEPGEAVRFAMRVSFSPPVGTQVQYFYGPPPGVGTVTAWGFSWFDFLGSGGTDGSFVNVTPAPLLQIDAIVAYPSWITLAVGQSNFAAPFNTDNPIEGLVVFTWIPLSYSPRTVEFHSRNATAKFTDLVLLRYGTSSSGEPLYLGAQTITNHTTGPVPSTGPITVVPGPGTGILIVLACAGAARRKRPQ